MLGRDELIILTGKRRGEVILLKSDHFVIGRETGDLLLEDDEVSSVHALFTREGRVWILSDLGSTNGVWVNGIAIEKSRVLDGSEILLGTTRLVLRTDDVIGGPGATHPGTEISQPGLDLSWVEALAETSSIVDVMPDSIYDDLTPTMELTVEALADPETERVAERVVEGRGRRWAKRRAAPARKAVGPALDSLPTIQIVLELEAISGGSSEVCFHLDAITIGRDPATDLTLQGHAVSGRHCAIEVFPAGEAYIRDLGSTNGTWVNGGRVTSTRLRIGDRIRVGRHTLRFTTRSVK